MGGGDAAGDGVDSSNDVGKEATLNIRCTNGSQLDVQAKLNLSVESFKSILAHRCEIPAHQQRLIYKGRILKDDQTLQSYGIEDDHTIHLVRGFATAGPADNETTTDAGVRNTNPVLTTDAGSNQGGPLGGSDSGSPLFPGLGLNGLGNESDIFGVAFPELEQMQQMLTQNPEMIRDFLNMPGVPDLMSNPETIRNMMMNNPQMREVMDRNPELSHVLNDPSTLRQTMEAARNPEIMREMMRNTDRAMSNIESSPEGFNMLRRMYENVQEPFLNASTMTGDDEFDIRSDEFPPLFPALGGRPGSENSNNSHAPNTNPLPNPWVSAGSGGMQTNLRSQVNPTDNGRLDSPDGLGGLVFPGLESMLGLMADNTSFNQLMQNPIISQMMRNVPSSRQLINQQLVDFQGLPVPSIVSRRPSREPGQNGGDTAGAADNMGLDQLINLFAGLGTGGGVTAPNRPQVPPEELYATQLSQLQEMGFFDTSENIRALIATAGSVNAAIERLLGNPSV
ncbi:hypothetical protein ACS0TY_029011 [Phlomoides rotata]